MKKPSMPSLEGFFYSNNEEYYRNMALMLPHVR